MSIKVAITDDHPLVINGLRYSLNAHADIDIIGAYTSGKELLSALKKQQPDVLLLDIQMPEMPGNKLVRIVTEKFPGINIIALTSMNTAFHIKDMMTHGCKGYVLKNANPEVLIQAIREVYKGREFLEPSLKQELEHVMLKEEKKTQLLYPTLTIREKEILQLIVSEHTNQEIADKLFLSQRTVETHRFNLQQKLRVKNTIGLVKVALQMGLAT